MDRPRICVSIAARSVAGALEKIRAVAPQGPDLVELRIDHIAELEGLERVRGATSLPLIATSRRRDQGGLYLGSERRRINGLREAIEVGFDYVDLELTTSSLDRVAVLVKEMGAKLIVSYHDLSGTPTKKFLEDTLESELNFEPDACKIVGTANSIAENLTYLDFLRENDRNRLICFGMGRLGAVSRILSPLFGGLFTYAAVEAGSESAPGQFTLGSLREIYRLMGV